MSKSDIHANQSVKKFGGSFSDYIEIHEMIDSSKAFWGDNRHRAIFHHSAGIYYIQKMFGIDFDSVEKLMKKYQLDEGFLRDFIDLMKTNRNQGVHILNSEGKKVHVRDIAEQHVLEDFRYKFIPAPGDYLSQMQLKPWMNNGMANIPSPENKAGESSSVISVSKQID